MQPESALCLRVSVVKNMNMQIWYLYIVRCGDDSLYSGVTLDVERRLSEHRAGKGSKYLRGRGPLRVVYVREFSSRGAALSAEISIKKLPRHKKERLLQEYGGVAPAGAL
jgi:predicted GIY-YIG superfamily endonuclease